MNVLQEFCIGKWGNFDGDALFILKRQVSTTKSGQLNDHICPQYL